MTYLLSTLGLLLLLQKAWMHWAIVRFFREEPPGEAQTTPRRVSVLQPILSGDPTLPACLEHNMTLSCRYPVEYLWLVDDDDLAGQRICQDLIARHPDRNARLCLLPPPGDRCSPKTLKVVAGVERSTGDVCCVLDDDTMLPEGGLEACMPYLDQPAVGLAFGLPYYVSFGNVWSRLVAYFVNSHSLLTYLPCAHLVGPFTINGMFYAFRRSVYEATGGFGAIEAMLADDFAVAQHFRRHGYRLAQTPVRHAISTHVTGPRAYLQLLHRWFIFPRETVMKALPPRDLLVAYGLALTSCLAPLFWLVGLLLRPSWWFAGQAALYVAYHYVIFAHCNLAYLRRASPWRWSWLVPVTQVLLPLQLLAAIAAPQRIAWRGHDMQIESGGTFRFVKRRGA